MQAHPPHRRISLVLPVLWVAVLVICSGAAVAVARASTSPTATPRPKLAGTWSGRYSGAFSGTFKLKWKQVRSRLVGSITLSNPGGKYRITGSVRGSAIKFGAVGVGATYTGKVRGTSMSGSYKTPSGVGRWSAHKVS